MSSPYISIVTPSFNQSKYIAETLLSLKNQNYTELQHIVVDGASTDGTLEILSEFKLLPHVLISESDLGQSDAINKGLALSTGEVFNWLNSDDTYCPGALRTVGKYFRDSHLDVLCARSIIYGDSCERLSFGTDIYADNLPKTIGFARVDQPETFYRRHCVDEVGGLDKRLHYVMDRHLWIKFLLSFGLNGVRKVDDVIVKFRLHEHSKTVSSKNEFQIEDRQLFAGLLHALGFPEVAIDFLGDTETPFLENLFLDLSRRPDAKEISAYILLNAFLIAYSENNFTRATWLRSVIDPAFLATEDRMHFNLVSNRLKFIPLPLKKIWNFLRGA